MNKNLHLWHWGDWDGEDYIIFDNVNVPDEFTGEHELFELIDLIKVMIRDKSNEGANCMMAIPVMQVFHNMGVQVFDYVLAIYYLEGKFVPKNEALAVELLRGGTKPSINDDYCMERLGECFEFGEGVAENAIAAMFWYEKAAKFGNELAALNAGIHYATGLEEVERNFKKAKYYLRQVKHNRQYKKIARKWLLSIKKGKVY